MVDEDPHDRVGNLRRLGRSHEDAGLAPEILVAGDAAKRQPEPHSRLDSEGVLHRNRRKADVVGVLQHRDHTCAVESDVELARDAIERTIVEDVEVPFASVRPGIDQFLRIDTGSRCAGDIADVVGARTARA